MGWDTNHVNPKTFKLVFAASPINTHQ